MAAQMSQVQAQESAFRYTPPEKYNVLLQCNGREFAQGLEMSQNKELMTPDLSLKRHLEIGQISPKNSNMKRLVDIGNFLPMSSGFEKDTERLLHLGLVREDSAGSKRRKKEEHPPTPTQSPVDESCGSVDHGMAQEKNDTSAKANENMTTQDGTVDDHTSSEDLSVAQVLTSLQGNTTDVGKTSQTRRQQHTCMQGNTFAVSNI